MVDEVFARDTDRVEDGRLAGGPSIWPFDSMPNASSTSCVCGVGSCSSKALPYAPDLFHHPRAGRTVVRHLAGLGRRRGVVDPNLVASACPAEYRSTHYAARIVPTRGHSCRRPRRVHAQPKGTVKHVLAGQKDTAIGVTLVALVFCMGCTSMYHNKVKNRAAVDFECAASEIEVESIRSGYGSSDYAASGCGYRCVNLRLGNIYKLDSVREPAH